MLFGKKIIYQQKIRHQITLFLLKYSFKTLSINSLIPLEYFSAIDKCAKSILFLEANSKASSSGTLLVFSADFIYKSYLLLIKT